MPKKTPGSGAEPRKTSPAKISIQSQPRQYEGGSMAPLVRHMRLYDYADGIAAELKKMYIKRKNDGIAGLLPGKCDRDLHPLSKTEQDHTLQHDTR